MACRDFCKVRWGYKKKDSSSVMASTPQNGEALWHARRKAWREARPQQPPVTSSQSLSAWLNENIQDRKQHLGIYNSLVVSRKPLNKPIPLSFIVRLNESKLLKAIGLSIHLYCRSKSLWKDGKRTEHGPKAWRHPEQPMQPAFNNIFDLSNAFCRFSSYLYCTVFADIHQRSNCPDILYYNLH